MTSPPAKPAASSSTAEVARRAIRIACLLAGLWLCGSAGAQTIILTPDQMRAQAMIASQDGRDDVAAAMVQALLRRDPDDFTAHLSPRASRATGATTKRRWPRR